MGSEMCIRDRSNTIYGAAFGAFWFVLYDKIFCPHGDKTMNRFLSAHALGGSFFMATFYHPSAFFYGSLLGLFVAFMKIQISPRTYPSDFRA